eukprot:4043074-Pleurochrysis_carterae.AAC.1
MVRAIRALVRAMKNWFRLPTCDTHVGHCTSHPCASARVLTPLSCMRWEERRAVRSLFMPHSACGHRHGLKTRTLRQPVVDTSMVHRYTAVTLRACCASARCVLRGF